MRRLLLLGAVVGAVLAASALLATGAQADTSGPTPSGYTWIDTNPPDPTTTFDWLDASGGTVIPSTDCDDCADVVPLPFTFYYFEVPYSAVVISTNGMLSFATDDTADCNGNYNWDNSGAGHPIPHDDANCGDDGWGRNPLIAAWFDDLDPGECGDVYYQTFGSAPNRTFVVQYNDVCHNDCSLCEPGEGITFEILLFEGSNDIKFQYMDAFFGTEPILKSAPPKDGRSVSGAIEDMNNGNSATVGLDKDATVGLQYSYAEPVINDDLAILFTGQPIPTPTATALPPPTPGVTAPAPSATSLPISLPQTGGSEGSSGVRGWLLIALTAAALAGLGGYALVRARAR